MNISRRSFITGLYFWNRCWHIQLNWTAGMKRTISTYLQCSRIKEVSLMVGLFFIGSTFSIRAASISNLITLSCYLIGTFFFVLSVYSINNYFGYEKDKNNHRLSYLKCWRKKRFLYSSLIYGSISFLIFYLLNVHIFVFATTSFLIWVCYYIPGVVWGHILPVGTAVGTHFPP